LTLFLLLINPISAYTYLNIYLDEKGETLYKKGHLILKSDALKIEAAGITEVFVRTPLTCKTLHGICRMCYGLDLARNRMVEKGEAVGIIAAQAIGEPGTQLTMRTFHSGGVAGIDITMGLPRVEEIFERRIPKNPAIVSSVNGEVIEINDVGREKVIKVLLDEDDVKKGKVGEVEFVAPFRRSPLVKVGSKIKKGDIITDGSADLAELYKYGGREAAEEYVIKEINNIYELQGASISRKHIEIIIRQMFSRKRIKESADTSFTVGELVENMEFALENARTKEAGGEVAEGESVILGITEVALSTKSWLSSASFQNVTRVLINSAVRGKIDDLRGLKENVIVGRLIPAGTGFKSKDKKEVVEEESEE